MGKLLKVSDDVYEYVKSLSNSSHESMSSIVADALSISYCPPWLEEKQNFLKLSQANKMRRMTIGTISSALFSCEIIEKRIVKLSIYDLRRLGNIDMMKTMYYIKAWKSFYNSIPEQFQIALANDDAHIDALSDPGFLIDYVSDLEKGNSAYKYGQERERRRRGTDLRKLEEKRKEKDRAENQGDGNDGSRGYT